MDSWIMSRLSPICVGKDVCSFKVCACMEASEPRDISEKVVVNFDCNACSVNATCFAAGPGLLGTEKIVRSVAQVKVVKEDNSTIPKKETTAFLKNILFSLPMDNVLFVIVYS